MLVLSSSEFDPTGHCLSCEPTKKAVSEVTPAYKLVMEEAEARDGRLDPQSHLSSQAQGLPKPSGTF
jgi:hypothetical protein